MPSTNSWIAPAAMTLEEALHVLELVPPFTRASLKTAYREAILVWHPDRFQGNPALQAKAEARTCAINEAYAILTMAMGSADGYFASSASAYSPAENKAHSAHHRHGTRVPPRATAVPPMVGSVTSPRRIWKFVRGALLTFATVAPFVGLLWTFFFLYKRVNSHRYQTVPSYNAATPTKTQEPKAESSNSPTGPSKRYPLVVKAPWAVQAKTDLTAEEERKRYEALVGRPEDAKPIPPAPVARLIPDAKLRHLPWEDRPTNGTVLTNDFQTKGRGELTLNNGMEEDAYVKIITGGQMVASFYVQGGQKFTFQGIPDGTYGIMYRKGYGWNHTQRAFERGMAAAKYDKPLTFAERLETQGNVQTMYWDVLTLTLHKVANGNASTTELPPEEFDRY